MSFVPYLHFQGTCEEAMAFYASIFGGEAQFMRYSDAPAETGATPSNRIMHSWLTIGDETLMASDYPEHVPGDAQAGASVMHNVPTAEAGQAVFDRLSEGGSIGIPYGPAFFSSGFGMVKDRFGTHWIVTAPPPAG